MQAESENTRDQTLPADTKGERRGAPRSVVQSVRLPADAFTEIEHCAEEAGVPTSALIRGWVLHALAAERGTSLKDAIDHLASETERLRRIAARTDVA
ncbi:hypothetical protein GCM10023353_24210 [Tomitella cavernea]|uniref:CopG family transcriptional regulator n=1 Tax=Tomitella cavernea TaxID=1387982 RepID=A0ABP9CRX7_9ACTN